MKKLAFFASLLVFAGACTQQDDLSSSMTPQSEPELYTGIAKDIYVDVLTNHFGGYHKGQPNTRAEGAFSITPYVEDGDTLMYIVQYEKGWELYSASKATNMLIFSSEEGVFDMNDPNRPKAMKTLIASSLEKIKFAKSSACENIDSCWGTSVIAADELKSGKITVNQKNGVQRNVSSSDVPAGEWILIGTEVISDETYTSPKLIKTKWHQLGPWNAYAKLVPNNNGTLVSALAGCSPIAISQYAYYTHYKDNIPKYCRANASLGADGVSYDFNGESSTLWDEMAKVFSLPANNLVSAVHIGAVGKELNAQYGLTSTTVKVEDEIKYLNKVYGITFFTASVDFAYIKSSIDQGYPILALATHTPSGINSAHRFLIDSYMTKVTQIKYIYGLRRYPLPPGEENIWEDDDVDEYGNIISYAYTNEVVNTTTTNKISMNWGDISTSDDNSFYYPTGDWYEESANLHYKYNQYILKRTDIK